jgi:hypothetical protein
VRLPHATAVERVVEQLRLAGVALGHRVEAAVLEDPATHLADHPDADAGVDAAGAAARVTRNGEEEAATADATEATGDPVDLVLHVANTVGEAGVTLRAGEVVICGSVVPAGSSWARWWTGCPSR